MSRVRTGALLIGLSTLVSAPATVAETKEAPPAALLEFLGQFEDAEGEWIDPLTLGELPAALPDEDTKNGEPHGDTDEDEALDDESSRATADGDGAR